MLYSLLFLLLISSLVSPLSEHPKLLLISFDGFRHDLLNSSLVPNIYRWSLDGAAFVNGVRSQYVSFTATNHMAIATGLYTENHGIVSNRFFDYAEGKLFDYWNYSHTPGIIRESLEEKWYTGEPIWLTNERADSTRHSACLYWPFGEVKFPGKPQRPSLYRAWVDYRSFDQWLSDVDTIVDLFTRERNPVNFVAWYIAEPDHTLHLNGFYNGELFRTLTQLDKLFAHLIDKLKSTGLSQHLNIIFTADHGHAQIEGAQNIMCVEDYVNVKKLFHGEFMIYTFETKRAEEVYRNLTSAVRTHGFKVKVYTRKDFPKHYNYAGISKRIGDIILEPAIGWDVQFNCTKAQFDKMYAGGAKLHSSTHGMDPQQPEMHATLVLHGPDIHPLQRIHRRPQNIDLYELMCFLLEIRCAPNNGTLITFMSNVSFKKIKPGRVQVAVSGGITDSTGIRRYPKVRKPMETGPAI
ncbi:hypothetical protein Y032_0043g829 [Ancylostoma ceylanicum]|uniref:Uncharacterized protein n=1 Tax=Ancylostoma ceylanicum TaxID=53326 RepID=A0A016UFF3_9BILA|nr:hypothetical protein Y032_0043g829 [Ancylostoma ceylanicum]